MALQRYNPQTQQFANATQPTTSASDAPAPGNVVSSLDPSTGPLTDNSASASLNGGDASAVIANALAALLFSKVRKWHMPRTHGLCLL
jgi:hypothetical protein